MNIAQFIGTDKISGAEHVAIQLVKAMDRRGEQSQLICNSRLATEVRARYNDINVLEIPEHIWDCWEGKSGVLRYGVKFGKFLRKNKIDVLHSHLFKATVFNAFPCWNHGIRHIGTQHDSYTITEKPSRHYWLLLARMMNTKLTAVSNSVANDCMLYDIRVIYNGIKTKDSIPEYVTNKERNTNNFIMVGRVIPLKRVDYVIKAMEYLKQEGFINATLTIVGGFSNMGYRDNIVRLISELGLQNTVHLVGETDDVLSYLLKADCYISASENEGLSLAMIEAMDARLPVISSDIKGNTELLGSHGYIFPLTDLVSAIAFQMKRFILLTNNERIAEGLKMKALVARSLTEEQMIEKYYLSYKQK